MANPDDIKKQKEINNLLKEENELLKRRLELQSDSYDLSSTILEDLKETLGIRSKLTTYEKGVYDINKQINRSIRDQKIEYDDVNDITKQIKKNSDLINKSKLFEQSLGKSLSKEQKEKAKAYLKEAKSLSDIDKQITKELNKAKEGKKIDAFRLEYLENERDLTRENLETQIESLGHLAQQYVLTKLNTKELEKQTREREKEEKLLKEAQKRLGIFGGLMKGLSKIQILQDLGVDFAKINKDALEKTKETKSGIEGLKAGLKSLGSELKDAFTNSANILLYVMLQVGKAILSVDKQTGDLAKGFNISYKEAKNIRKELFQMAVDSGDLTSNVRAYQETILSIGKALGSNAVLNKKDLQTFTDLREKAGLTNEELNEQQKLAYVSGQYLKDNVGSMLSAAKVTGLNNKILLNEKDIMRDIGKTSNAIKLSLGGQGDALGKAAAQVKVLGMNMQQVENIAGSLLNFESSISAELEAELLTGKNLNLEMARLYAINNDMEGVAREIRKNYGSIADFQKMNRLQQDAAAKAVGMTREELARTLTDEKALAGLNGEKRNAAQAALEFARAKGMTEEQIRKEEISNLENQMSIQERLNASVEKLKESFVIIAETLAPVFEGFANLVGWLAKSKTTMAVMVGLASAIAISSAITAVANIFGGSARVLGPLAAITGGLITGIMFASMDSAESKAAKAKQSMGDGEFDNSTGNFQITHKEGGIFVPSKNDQMAVGPDVVDRLKISKRSSTPDAYWGEQLANMSNQVSILTANVTKMIQTPPTFMVEGKVDNETFIKFNSNNSNKIAAQSAPNNWAIS